MFKWPSSPTQGASKRELADFAELICWKDSHTSATALSRLLGRLGEGDRASGVQTEEEADSDVNEAYDEIERRMEACGGGYPFEVGYQGSTLQPVQDVDNPRHDIYKFLLLATRLQMDSNQRHANIDGTQVFEELSAEVAKAYLGDRARSLVFGTAAGSSNFPQKVGDLSDQLNEGGGYLNNGGVVRPKDGKLDVVAWKPFTDDLPGKLIGFGQCKTGTHYEDDLTKLQPSTFRDMWLRSPIVVPPVRMFFIAEALNLSPDDRLHVSRQAGLLFDRCRIIDFCDSVDTRVLAKLRQWTEAAALAANVTTA